MLYEFSDPFVIETFVVLTKLLCVAIFSLLLASFAEERKFGKRQPKGFVLQQNIKDALEAFDFAIAQAEYDTIQDTDVVLVDPVAFNKTKIILEEINVSGFNVPPFDIGFYEKYVDLSWSTKDFHMLITVHPEKYTTVFGANKNTTTTIEICSPTAGSKEILQVMKMLTLE